VGKTSIDGQAGGPKKAWQTYEEVAAYLLNQFAAEFDLGSVIGKQSVPGISSGTTYVIDAKGFKQDGEGFVVVECRRYTTSKLNQERVGALAYRIWDTRAEGGIIVSPLGLQEGAKRIAQAENIIEVSLDPASSCESYVIAFLNKVIVGVTETLTMTESGRVIVSDPDGTIRETSSF